MYYLFLDESGDHGLKNVDPGYPVFVLCGVLIRSDKYEAVREWQQATNNCLCELC